MIRKRSVVCRLLLLTGGMLVLALRLCPAAPAPIYRGPPRVEALSRQARSADPATRERAQGLLLSHLKPGMTRDQVESLLGPPLDPITENCGDGLGRLVGVYHCELPGQGRVMMFVHYDPSTQPFTFVEVSGPHHPGCG